MANDEEKNKYDKALTELAKLFCGIDKVIIHQYGFVLFYLPVYELLLEIKRTLDSEVFKGHRNSILGENNSLEIIFENYDSDIDCCKALIEAKDLLDLNQIDNKLILHLGLSEPPSSLCDTTSKHTNMEGIEKESEAGNYHEIPFIRNFPLWGMALSNNPKIRKIESEKATSFATQSGIRYWDHFASNVTLLSKKTVDQFTYSVHSSTSTTFLEFKNRVADEKDILVIEPNEEDKEKHLDEFTFIFRGQADVALTHQPWVGIKRGSSPPIHRDLEIVYTHVWGIKRKPASALYFFAKDPNHFHKALAHLFARTVMYHVTNVSKAWTPEQMRNMATYYCGTVLKELGNENEECLPLNCQKCKARKETETSKDSLEDFLTDNYSPDDKSIALIKCLEETAVGYQVCIHNQIFFDPLLKYNDDGNNKNNDMKENGILWSLGEITR